MASQAKGKAGKLLYSPKELNARFKEEFRQRGWKANHTTYWLTDDYELVRRTMSLPPAEQKTEIEMASKHALRSSNQTDFVKDRVAVEVQLGKYAFVSHDLFVKHLAFYVGDKIDVGIELLPTKQMQLEMPSDGYYEGALYDIARQGRGVPAVPVLLIGLTP